MANMLDDITALELAAKRTSFDLSDLDTWPYVLVGSGAYVEQILTRLDKANLRLPEYILVQEKMTFSVNVEQHIDDGKSPISASHIVLGSGSFQLEMLHRLLPRCDEETIFIDVMECAPKTYRTLGDAEQYLIYVDLYSDINIPKYLTNFLAFLNRHGIRVEVFHPLENLSDEYVKNSKGLIVWNGTLPAFIPMLSQAQRLSQNITFAECGFFPQHQYFYLDRCGVNNEGQLYHDDLDWVNVLMVENLEQVTQSYYANPIDRQFFYQNYVFVPLQVPSDSNVLKHSRFTHGMQEFIDFIEQQYPSELVIFKPHPKDRLKDVYQYKRGVVSNKSILTLISHAKVVHGINSSVLYEAVLMDKPVKVEGDCLLAKHQHQPKRLLAAMCYRQFLVGENDFSYEKLRKFSYLKLLNNTQPHKTSRQIHA